MVSLSLAHLALGCYCGRRAAAAGGQLLTGRPAFLVSLQRASALMVPVAKNGATPPP